MEPKLFRFSILLLLITFYLFIETVHNCPNFSTDKKGTPEVCAKYAPYEAFQNLPILTGVYCKNDHSYICKAFAGRFEFYFNTLTDDIIGPVNATKYVNDQGYHERVPVSYDVNGNVNYVDRAINWARDFARSKKDKKFNILSTQSFNWCGYVEKGFWPYRSSIKYGQYHVYFYNRQTCIYDTVSKKRQHFNTRFIHKSESRIDLDYNPTMFAMEDPVTKDNSIRLVKHKRQHWYEVRFEVKAGTSSTPNVNFYLKMEPKDEQPLKLNGSYMLFTAKSYRKRTNICIDDSTAQRNDANGKLVDPWCGLDEVEIADLPYPGRLKNQTNSPVYEVDLHQLPRFPHEVERFYDTAVKTDGDWQKWALYGRTFSATTTIPYYPGDSKRWGEVKVIMFLSHYNIKEPGNEYDEYWPEPILMITNGTFTENADWWKIERNYNNVLRDLNYVDDIAYLYKCNTILVILGPLYTELPVEGFSIQSSGYIGPIDDLGIYELANAFFNEPLTDIIWVYHRTNWVESVSYTCGKLVTAQKSSGKYYPRHATAAVPHAPVFPKHTRGNLDYTYCEECYWSWLEIYKGDTSSPEAPDPKKYAQDYSDVATAIPETDSLFLWIIIGIGIIIILIMAIVCLTTMSRRRKRVYKEQELLQRTLRSGVSSGVGMPRTNRSAISSLRAHSSAPTIRTKLSSSRGSVPGSQSRATTAFGRPAMTGRSGLSGVSGRSGRSKSSGRSGVSGRSGASGRSTSTPRRSYLK